MAGWTALWHRMRPGLSAGATMEVGEVGGDLPFWRAREAVRHGELRLAVQAQAMQSLEGRATSMLGWSVTGGLALGAAVGRGTHRLAAFAAAACLVAAASLCLWALVKREWSGVAGYAPAALLEDRSGSEYEALVALAKGYQAGVDLNQKGFHFFERLLRVAICLIVAAPLAGLAVLASETLPAKQARPPAMCVRAALACPEYWLAPGWSARAPCRLQNICGAV